MWPEIDRSAEPAGRYRPRLPGRGSRREPWKLKLWRSEIRPPRPTPRRKPKCGSCGQLVPAIRPKRPKEWKPDELFFAGLKAQVSRSFSEVLSRL